jgi:hypothetical protein
MASQPIWPAAGQRRAAWPCPVRRDSCHCSAKVPTDLPLLSEVGTSCVLSQAIWSASHLSWPNPLTCLTRSGPRGLRSAASPAGAAQVQPCARLLAGRGLIASFPIGRPGGLLSLREPKRDAPPLPPHPSGRLTGVTASCAARRRFREEADFIPSSAKPPHHHKLLHLEAEFCGDLANP